MADPIKTTVVRFKCPHCNRHHSRRPAAVEHIARCFLNPDNRTCRSCKFHCQGYFSRPTDWCEPGRSCTCNDEPEHCAASGGPEPEVWPVIGCPLWEPVDGSKQ